MFKIVRFPEKLDSFFERLRCNFLYGHFDYFKYLVLSIAFSWERRNVADLYRYLDVENQTHRTRFNNFLNVGRWDPEDVLRDKAMQILSQLKPRRGETISLVIDDTKKEKRGKKMDAVGGIYDPVSDRKLKGHQYVFASIRFRGRTIPFGICLYVKDRDCPNLGLVFKTTTEMAADMIRKFVPPEGVSVQVLFDSFYLCETVTAACKEKGFFYISTLKNNRLLKKNGREFKVKKYAENIFRRKGKVKSFTPKDKKTVYNYHEAGWMGVSKMGKMHVVFSRRKGEKTVLGIATNNPNLSASGMIDAYGERWSVEVFFKDAKQLLGLGQYQNRSYRAAVIHLHLVCFAYALLTHIAIESDNAQGKRQRKSAKASTRYLQYELRRIVWNDLVDSFKESNNDATVFERLSRLRVAA